MAAAFSCTSRNFKLGRLGYFFVGISYSCGMLVGDTFITGEVVTLHGPLTGGQIFFMRLRIVLINNPLRPQVTRRRA